MPSQAKKEAFSAMFLYHVLKRRKLTERKSSYCFRLNENVGCSFWFSYALSLMTRSTSSAFLFTSCRFPSILSRSILKAS